MAYPASNFTVTHLMIAILKIFKWKHSLFSLWSKKMYLKAIFLGVSLVSQATLPILGIMPHLCSFPSQLCIRSLYLLNLWFTLLRRLLSNCHQTFFSMAGSLERVEQDVPLLVWEILFVFISAMLWLRYLPEKYHDILLKIHSVEEKNVKKTLLLIDYGTHRWLF